MITKEEIKKEVDKLPESLLDMAYAILRSIAGIQKARIKAGQCATSMEN